MNIAFAIILEQIKYISLYETDVFTIEINLKYERK